MSGNEHKTNGDVEVMHKDEKTEVKFSTERTPTTEAEPGVSLGKRSLHCF